jgi:hypothetical protein
VADPLVGAAVVFTFVGLDRLSVRFPRTMLYLTAS